MGNSRLLSVSCILLKYIWKILVKNIKWTYLTIIYTCSTYAVTWGLSLILQCGGTFGAFAGTNTCNRSTELLIFR